MQRIFNDGRLWNEVRGHTICFMKLEDSDLVWLLISCGKNLTDELRCIKYGVEKDWMTEVKALPEKAAGFIFSQINQRPQPAFPTFECVLAGDFLQLYQENRMFEAAVSNYLHIAITNCYVHLITAIDFRLDPTDIASGVLAEQIDETRKSYTSGKALKGKPKAELLIQTTPVAAEAIPETLPVPEIIQREAIAVKHLNKLETDEYKDAIIEAANDPKSIKKEWIKVIIGEIRSDFPGLDCIICKALERLQEVAPEQGFDTINLTSEQEISILSGLDEGEQEFVKFIARLTLSPTAQRARAEELDERREPTNLAAPFVPTADRRQKFESANQEKFTLEFEWRYFGVDVDLREKGISLELQKAMRPLLIWSQKMGHAPPKLIITSDFELTEGSLAATSHDFDKLYIHAIVFFILNELNPNQKEVFLTALMAVFEGHEKFHVMGEYEYQAIGKTRKYLMENNKVLNAVLSMVKSKEIYGIEAGNFEIFLDQLSVNPSSVEMTGAAALTPKTVYMGNARRQAHHYIEFRNVKIYLPPAICQKTSVLSTNPNLATSSLINLVDIGNNNNRIQLQYSTDPQRITLSILVQGVLRTSTIAVVKDESVFLYFDPVFNIFYDIAFNIPIEPGVARERAIADHLREYSPHFGKVYLQNEKLISFREMYDLPSFYKTRPGMLRVYRDMQGESRWIIFEDRANPNNIVGFEYRNNAVESLRTGQKLPSGKKSLRSSDVFRQFNESLDKSEARIILAGAVAKEKKGLGKTHFSFRVKEDVELKTFRGNRAQSSAPDRKLYPLIFRRLGDSRKIRIEFIEPNTNQEYTLEGLTYENGTEVILKGKYFNISTIIEMVRRGLLPGIKVSELLESTFDYSFTVLKGRLTNPIRSYRIDPVSQRLVAHVEVHPDTFEPIIPAMLPGRDSLTKIGVAVLLACTALINTAWTDNSNTQSIWGYVWDILFGESFVCSI